jgi:hypothetical protein
MAVGQRRLVVVAVLERLHQLAGPGALFQLARQPQRQRLRLPARLVAFHISLAGRHGHLVLRLRQTLWLLVVELVQLRRLFPTSPAITAIFNWALRHRCGLPIATAAIMRLSSLQRH